MAKIPLRRVVLHRQAPATSLKAAEFAFQATPWGLPAATEKAPPAPTPSAMQKAIAYVDPSRLISSKLFTPYNPSILVSRKGLSIYDEMKRDEQVKSALGFKKIAVLAGGWEVISPGDQEDDWEVTEFVRTCFEQFPGGWHDACKKFLQALDYGYSVTEKVYAEGTGPLEGKMSLHRLVALKPHYLDFVTDASGHVEAISQMPVAGRQADNEFHPAKFVHYVYDREFENAYGKADLEAAYRSWWVKDNAYKWFAVMLERYGMAPLFAMYDPNQYQGPVLDELKKVVKNIQNATMGMIPRSNGEEGLELWSQDLASGSKEVFLAALARFDADIAKALLMPSLIGFAQESGSTGAQSGGSLARSNTSFKTFMMVVDEIKNDLAAQAINSQIIPQLCDLNFAGLKSYPVFKFLRTDDDTEYELFNTWSQLVSGKIVNRIEDDEVHIRKQLGFPANDSPVLEPLPADALADAKVKAGDEKPVPKEKQTVEMRQFAEANAGEWYEVDGQYVCYAAWDESKHPRHPAGSSQGGEFAPAAAIAHMDLLRSLEKGTVVKTPHGPGKWGGFDRKGWAVVSYPHEDRLLRPAEIEV